VEWYWHEKTQLLGEIPYWVLRCPPQIPHGLILDRTWPLGGESLKTSRLRHGMDRYVKDIFDQIYKIVSYHVRYLMTMWPPQQSKRGQTACVRNRHYIIWKIWQYSMNPRSVKSVFGMFTAKLCTRPVRKISCHFEYLENRSRGLDGNWQPVRGDLTVYPWTVTLPWG